MSIQFDPKSEFIRLLMTGMGKEDEQQPEEAAGIFLNAWENAADDFERFLAAFYVARHQQNPTNRLKWLETSLQCGMNTDDDTVKSAFPLLYSTIGVCHRELGNSEKAIICEKLSNSYRGMPTDKGPFYHGTRADLKIGDLLTAGRDSNYQADLKINHIYFTGLVNGAGLAAALAKGDGRQRIYIVEPTGAFENDPNVTDKKFPGNLTRSYRSLEPLKIVGEETKWLKQTSAEISQWRENLANNKGEIIN